MNEEPASAEGGGPGRGEAAEALLPIVYEELRRLAQASLARERPGQTLQPTALVHEAYLRLTASKTVTWENRAHFFGAAAEAMRRILIERARRRAAVKHGGGRDRIALGDAGAVSDKPDTAALDLLTLDSALARLAAEDPQKAELVRLRYYAGLTLEQVGEAMGISRATADRWWAYARAWLFHEVGGSEKAGKT